MMLQFTGESIKINVKSASYNEAGKIEVKLTADWLNYGDVVILDVDKTQPLRVVHYPHNNYDCLFELEHLNKIDRLDLSQVKQLELIGFQMSE